MGVGSRAPHQLTAHRPGVPAGPESYGPPGRTATTRAEDRVPLTSRRLPGVQAELGYLDPGSGLGRLFIARGASISTDRTEKHAVTIRNGRAVQDSFELDVYGFEVVDHSSALTDFTDPAELQSVYVPEVCRFVQE